MRVKKKINPKFKVLCLILALILLFYAARMLQIQVINADYYISQSNNTRTRTATIKAARGEILDRYGRPLAVNREGYNIVFNKAYLATSDTNGIIKTLIALLDEHKLTYNDVLPMKAETPYAFDGTDSKILSLRKRLSLANYATAENCFDQMISKYSLEGMKKEDQRLIMGVRYSMEVADFSVSSPYTFAEDIGDEVMMLLEESDFDFSGVEISVVPIREYIDTALVPHILGSVGPIYADDWAGLKSQGYSYNDKVGKSGIEKAEESYLKGTDGTVTYSVDSAGNILSSEVSNEPVNGNTVVLTIDKTIQAAASKSLAEVVKSLQETDSAVTGGAAVVIEVGTGEVLASANYPTYSLDDYAKNYKELASAKGNPLFDRAFNGVYPPGSAFKPAVASTALQTGNITVEEELYCKGVYTFFKDYHPHCLHVHGWTSLNKALAKSCNYYFFEVGRRIGIETLNDYCRKFGLGEYSGVEVVESKGILAGPQYSESVGKTWTAGNTIQAAIGQSDNSFTPLQLATYTATVASGGIRYRSTLIDKVLSYTLDEEVYINKPELVSKVGLDSWVVDAVKKGMLSVTEDGTGAAIFNNYPIKVGGKTGTAEAPGGAHGVFIAFAPYDNPEIAVAVVIEHSQSSRSAGTVVKSIFDAYFFTDSENYKTPDVNVLLP